MHRPIRRHGSHSAGRSHLPTRLPTVSLEITRGRARNSVRRIEGLAYLIGSAEDNDLVLADSQFPDSHSYLLRSPLGLTLCWLGDGPEITVDAVPVLSSALVPDGARLRTGPYEFRIRLEWPTTSAAEVAASTGEIGESDFPRSITRPEIVIADVPLSPWGSSSPTSFSITGNY
ncbi:MAG: FHA domain-containing protein [Planctomycetia bacterium]|nr:FHA domain-containing protein [Planctomycetia bacterium]